VTTSAVAGDAADAHEARELSRAYNESTRLALARLTAEATAVGAHGVVSVRATFGRPAWAQGAIEVRVIGTAVREPDAPGALWLCDLSGQDWWALRRGGWRLVAFVYGHCAWVAVTGPDDRRIVRGAISAEFEHFGDALRQCRQRAAGQMAEMSAAAGGQGIVGVHLQRRLEDVRVVRHHPGRTGVADPREGDEVAEAIPFQWSDNLLVLSATGTAVRAAPAPAATARLRLVVPLTPRRERQVPVTAEATFE